MGVSQRAVIAAELLAGGLDPATPVAAIRSATTPDQVVARCRLDELEATPVESPAVIVIGAGRRPRADRDAAPDPTSGRPGSHPLRPRPP